MNGLIKKIGVWAISLLMVATLIMGCGKSTETNTPAKPKYDQLTVYVALPETELPTYYNAFEKDTGIKIKAVRLSAGEILARMTAEKNNPQASVFHGGSSENFIQASKQGLLDKYTSPDKNLPVEYIDKEGYWTPYYLGAICFACNKDWFKKNNLKYPESWDDLLKTEFKGQISMAHPGTSGTSFTVLASIVQLMGEEKSYEYFKKLNVNVRQYTKSGGAPSMQVGLGEAAIALSFSADALVAANQGYPVELSFPKEGTGYEIGALGIIKGAPEVEKENAKRFIDWVISKRGQELFETAKAFRMPINITAKQQEGVIKVTDLKTIKYDSIWAGENRKRLIEKFIKEIANDKNLKQ